jgi:flagellar protein FliO/FliZ
MFSPGRLVVIPVTWLASAAAFAQAPELSMPKAAATPDLAQLVVSLVIVLGLILAAAWAVRRFQLLGNRNTGSLRVVSSLALGPKERLLLVDAGDRRLLLGVSAAGIVTLDADSKSQNNRDGAAPTEFSSRLDKEARRWAAGS